MINKGRFAFRDRTNRSGYHRIGGMKEDGIWEGYHMERLYKKAWDEDMGKK
jgi:hypothetical protein